VKERLHHAIGRAGGSPRLPPNGTPAINGWQQRDRIAAEWAGAGASHVPEGADLADEGIPQRFGADIDSTFCELLQDFVAAFAQVLDAARRMLRIPVVTDGEVGEHIDVCRCGKLVTLAG